MTETVLVRCPAKLNLTLEVLARRSDGYHELRTIFQAVDLADELTITRGAPATELTVRGLAVPVEGNLCWQAWEHFRQALKLSDNVAMVLDKRIPPGAGLGGGSSDAAGALVGLAHLYGVKVPGLLPALAARLGSDVPFFLAGGTAEGRGRGEVLAALPPVQGGGLVIAKPDLEVATADAYRWLTEADFTGGQYTTALRRLLVAGISLPETGANLYNVFQRPIAGRWPQIRELRQQLLRQGAGAALMTGSGAAVFGVFSDYDRAAGAAEQLAAAGIWAVAARPAAGGVEVIAASE